MAPIIDRHCSAIVAVGENLEIGRGGSLPWHYPSDLRFFRETTTDHVVLMGRKTFESIGSPLPNRKNLVLSRRSQRISGVTVASDHHSIDEALRGVDPASKLYVIGGAQVYEYMNPMVDEWLITRIPLSVPEADTYLPAHLLEPFTLKSQRSLDGGLVVQRWGRRG